MILKRKNKQSIWAKIRNFIWPSIGIKRTLKYYKHRIIRMPHSTQSISMGLAAGCVVSWTPSFPFHILQCYIFSRIFKANFPAAVLGTAFGNPWSFPILFMISYHVGHFFLSVTGLYDVFVMLAGETELFNQHGFGIQKFLPTLVGGYIMAVLTYPMFYYGFYTIIAAGRASRRVVSKKVHKIIDSHHERKEQKANQ